MSSQRMTKIYVSLIFTIVVSLGITAPTFAALSIPTYPEATPTDRALPHTEENEDEADDHDDEDFVDLEAVAEFAQLDYDTLRQGVEQGQSIAEVAQANGVDTQTLLNRLLSAEQAELTAAVTEGELTQQEATEEFAEITKEINQLIVQKNLSLEPIDHDQDEEDLEFLQPIATALQIDVTSLETQLKAGQSLADIAKAQGINPQLVIDTLASLEKTMIAEEVAAGEITQAEADESLATLIPDLQELMEDPALLAEEVPEIESDLIEQIADLLYISPDQLATALETQTIADVAQAQGVAPKMIVDAFVAMETEVLAQEVREGEISQEEANEIMAELDDEIYDLIHQQNLTIITEDTFEDEDAEDDEDGISLDELNQNDIATEPTSSIQVEAPPTLEPVQPTPTPQTAQPQEQETDGGFWANMFGQSSNNDSADNASQGYLAGFRDFFQGLFK
ncbi:MAG: hypothetical protein AAF485_12420 [Chloroflexota bacterium]